MPAPRNPLRARLEPLVGEWEMVASVDGQPTASARASFAWLEDGQFLVHRVVAGPPPADVPEEWIANAPFPTVAIIAADDASETFGYAYADARGVCRMYRMTLDDSGWAVSGQAAADFFQRFHATVAGDGRTINGRWERSHDGSAWETDFDVTYTRMD